MSSELIIPLISRWVHIGSAAVIVGGFVYLHFVCRPAAAHVIEPEQQRAFFDAMMKRWKMFVHPSILLFLASGFYNYLVVTAPAREGQGVYHMLFGVKFLLAILVFALAIILTSTRRWSENLRKNTALWAVLLVLLLAIVAVGGFMKVLPEA